MQPPQLAPSYGPVFKNFRTSLDGHAFDIEIPTDVWDFSCKLRDLWGALVLGPIHALEISSSDTLDIKYDSLMQEYTFGAFFFK